MATRCIPVVESLEEAQEALKAPLSRMADFIIEDITTKSCVHLKLVSDTPRLYRRTNREASDCKNCFIKENIYILKVEYLMSTIGQKSNSENRPLSWIILPEDHQCAE